MRIADLSARRVAIWGYGREGRAAVMALRARAPQLVPTLFCSEAEARILDAELAVTQAGAIGSMAPSVVTTEPDAAALARSTS